jgi:hypothetical protein
MENDNPYRTGKVVVGKRYQRLGGSGRRTEVTNTEKKQYLNFMMRSHSPHDCIEAKVELSNLK